MKPEANIVWLKRDLRLRDHAALAAAEAANEDYLLVYIFEPSMLSYEDSSLRHQRFVFHSLMAMNKELKRNGREILIFHTEATAAFEFLHQNFEIGQVFSHSETGTEKTWQRDKEIAAYLLDKKIDWKEFQSNGILRGIENRNR